MATPLFQKLRIRENDVLLTLHAPAGFHALLGELPPGVTLTESGKNYTQVHWFVRDKKQVEKEGAKTLKLLKENVILWIYYPKGSSGMQTDLTRDKGWDSLQQHSDALTWISLVSFDDTWSVFGCRLKTAADQKKEGRPRPQSPIQDYADPVTRQVRLPDDLATVLKKHKKEAAFFETLSYTNKKEYVEWIVSAKRDETRKERINGTLERLSKSWKNPRNS